MNVKPQLTTVYMKNTSTTPSPDQKFSLLHQYVISDDLQKAEKLLQRGKLINGLDKRRWTPLHHATALKNDPMRKLLIKYGVDTAIPNDCGATPEDFYRFTTGVKKNSDTTQQIPLFNSNNHLFTYEEYKQVTGTTYLTDQLVSSSSLIAYSDRRWGPIPIHGGGLFQFMMGGQSNAWWGPIPIHDGGPFQFMVGKSL